MSLAIIINPISGGGRPGDGARPRRARGRRARRRTASTARFSSPSGAATRTSWRGARWRAARAGRRLGRRRHGQRGRVRAGRAPTPRSASCRRDRATAWRASSASSRDPARAIAEALRAVPRVDRCGECEGRWFFNVAGIGFDAHVAACFDRGQTGRRGLVDLRAHHAARAADLRAASYRIDGGSRPAVRRCSSRSPTRRSSATAPRIAPRRAARRWPARSRGVRRDARGWRRCCRCRGCSPAGSSGCRGVSIRQIDARRRSKAIEPMIYHLDGEPSAGRRRGSTSRVDPGRAARQRALSARRAVGCTSPGLAREPLEHSVAAHANRHVDRVSAAAAGPPRRRGPPARAGSLRPPRRATPRRWRLRRR